MSQDRVAAALAAFRTGRLVAMPTETVYGLAAPVNRPDLVRRIFTLKERPFFNPLIVHLAAPQQLALYADAIPEAAGRLAEAFWPGPLTLVLKRRRDLNRMITGGLEQVGLRCPDHPLALELIRRLGAGLAAPSANKFTRVSPTCAGHVRAAFCERDVYLLDGGACRVGIESTVVAVRDDALHLLRPGMITPAMLERATGLACNTDAVAPGGEPREVEAPGQLQAHYRPAAPLLVSRLPVEEIDWNRVGDGCKLARDDFELRQLNPAPQLAARELYALLHRPPAAGYKGLLLQLPDTGGDWEAVHNRLRKAAMLWLEKDAGRNEPAP